MSDPDKSTVFIPAFKLSEVIDGASDAMHPAFEINGEKISGFYAGKYLCAEKNGKIVMERGLSPKTGVDFDEAADLCAGLGNGYHLMTAFEWGAIALWCKKNRCLPKGNNDYGKDVSESETVASAAVVDNDGKINQTLTGSGPLSWNHDGTADGISDLNGNVWEWSGAFRLVNGELQVLSGYPYGDQTKSSPSWRAIDGKSGELIKPWENGMTEGSVKLDFDKGVWKYTAGELLSRENKIKFCAFRDVYADSSVGALAREKLYALGYLPTDNDACYDGVSFYVNNGAPETVSFRGGKWSLGKQSGLFKSCIDDPRTLRTPSLGFRAALIKE